MLIRLLIHFCLVAVAMILVSYIIPGIRVKSFGTAFIAALILGIANALIMPILRFITAPINWLTLGLFSLVLSGLALKVVAELVDGFDVKGWLDAILGALLISIVSGVMQRVMQAIGF
jgi:putative membrane protein